MRVPNWKVIGTDNLCRETVADFDVCALCSEVMAKEIADALNSTRFDHHTWFVAVPWDRRLGRGLEDIV